MSDDRMPAFSLELPPIPAYLGTARLFVGSVARSFGVSEEAVDDCKVAVSEACTSAIRHRGSDPQAAPLRVIAQALHGRLLFEVPEAIPDAQEMAPESTTEDLVRTLGLEMIQALFPDVETISGSEGLSTVRIGLDTEPG